MASSKKLSVGIWAGRLAFPLIVAPILSRSMHAPFLNIWVSVALILLGLAGMGIYIQSGDQYVRQELINQVTDENLKKQLGRMKSISIFLAGWLIANMTAIMIFYFIRDLTDPMVHDAVMVCLAITLGIWWVSTIYARTKYDRILKVHQQMSIS